MRGWQKRRRDLAQGAWRAGGVTLRKAHAGLREPLARKCYLVSGMDDHGCPWRGNGFRSRADVETRRDSDARKERCRHQRRHRQGDSLLHRAFPARYIIWTVMLILCGTVALETSMATGVILGPDCSMRARNMRNERHSKSLSITIVSG